MNTLTIKSALFIIPISALMFQACGSKTASGGASTTGVQSSTSASISNPVPVPTPTPTPTPSACSHTQNAYVAPHTYVLSGQGTSNGLGTAIKYTPTIPAGIDQTLKVQIVPKTNSQSSMAILKSGSDVTLVMDGVDVAGSTVTLPGGVDTNNFRNGLAINAKSAIVDFSTYLVPGNHTYKIKVNNVQSDINCRMYCTVNYYAQQFYWMYGYYDWNMIYQMTNSCQQANCNVGYEPAEYWSIQVSVETDATPCLTP